MPTYEILFPIVMIISALKKHVFDKKFDVEYDANGIATNIYYFTLFKNNNNNIFPW